MVLLGSTRSPPFWVGLSIRSFQHIVDVPAVSDQKDGNEPVTVQDAIHRTVSTGRYSINVFVDLFRASNRTRSRGEKVDVVSNAALVLFRQRCEFFNCFRVELDPVGRRL
jgi:hypothetical protein